MFKSIYQTLPKPQFWFKVGLAGSLIIVELLLTISAPHIKKTLFNALADKQLMAFVYGFLTLLGLLTSMHLVRTTKEFLIPSIAFFIRQHTYGFLYPSWIKSKVTQGYSIPLTQGIHQSTTMLLECGVELVISSLIVVCLILSNYREPKILLVGSLGTIFITGLLFMFRKPMISAEKSWQDAEGMLREYLGKKKTNHSSEESNGTMDTVKSTFRGYLKTRIIFNLIGYTKPLLLTCSAYLLFINDYFFHGMSLGSYMEKVAIFEILILNSTVIVTYFPIFTRALASHSLVEDFHDKVVAKKPK